MFAIALNHILFDQNERQLSEIFWEGLEHFLETRSNLVTGPISESNMKSSWERYAQATYVASEALENYVRFIDGTVFGIA